MWLETFIKYYDPFKEAINAIVGPEYGTSNNKNINTHPNFKKFVYGTNK